MSNLTVPTPIGHKLARAKSLLRRDETLRALEALISALESYSPQQMPGKARFEIEVTIQECVSELNRQPGVRSLFEALAKSKDAFVPYTPGKEKKLLGVLTLLNKALLESIEAKERGKEEESAKRRSTLEQKGLEHLKAGDAPRGKASLRVLAEEFGHQPGVLAQAGEWLMEHKLFFDAAEMFEQAMEQFPREGKAYGLAALCYREMHEFEKCESVYLAAIKAFGRHPKTLLNLATLYLAWNKKEKAFEAAQDAYKKDNSLTEAKEIIDKLA